MGEVHDRLTEFAMAMKEKGHSRKVQEMSMVAMWKVILDGIYDNGKY